MRVAIVGCGRAARQHVEALTLTRSGRVVAVVDDDQGRAGEMARATESTAQPLAAVLEDPAVDVVSICTPPDTHAPIAVAALHAGKGVVVEKPVTPTLADLDAILSA